MSPRGSTAFYRVRVIVTLTVTATVTLRMSRSVSRFHGFHWCCSAQSASALPSFPFFFSALARFVASSCNSTSDLGAGRFSPVGEDEAWR